MKSNNSSPSNSKSEDTPNLTSLQSWIDIHTNGTCKEADDCVVSLAQMVQKELTPEPPQENCGIQHVDEDYGFMNCNLLKGHDGEHQTILIGPPPQDSPLGQVTSLDDILWYPGLGQEKLYAAMRAKVEAWHKAERAKLFEQIRSEVIGEDEYPNEHFPTYLGHKDDALAKKFDKVVIRDRLRAEQREALTRLEDNVINGGSL